jgi:hypothetical protein
MADNDRTRGYRDNETYRRQRSQPSPASGDPLAELARLIGQQNESAPSSAPRGAPSPYGREPAADPGWAAPEPLPQQASYRQDASHWQDDPAAVPGASGGGRYDPHFDAGAARSGRGYGAAPSYPSSPDDEPGYAETQYSQEQYSDPQYADPRFGDSRYAGDPRYDDAHYTDPRYADPRYADAASQGYADQHYPEPNFRTPHSGGPSFAPAPDGYPQSGSRQGYPAYAHQDDAQAYGNAYGDPYLGAPPSPGAMAAAAGRHAPAKRRGSMVTVLAVLALAVVGTAAAFGYRAMFTGAGSPVPPPVIKADTQPSKVVPATDPNSKPIQDRIGVKTEKIVPRQEEPVQQAAPGQPRVIAPFLAGQNPQAFPPASANIAPAGQATAPAAGAPKRIKTVPIKPQGAEAPGPRSSRGTAPAAQSDDIAAADTHSPMALAPTGSVPPTQRPAGRQAHAALTPNDPAAASPFPTPLPASTGPARGAVSGPYAVQVTSQRSEADAQASYRSLQQQFPSVLGNRQSVIRRADLGDRGTYYRAQIPFASQSEASDFCSSLKSAGGQCVVQRN